MAGGAVPAGRHLPGESLFDSAYERSGENLVAMGMARVAKLVAPNAPRILANYRFDDVVGTCYEAHQGRDSGRIEGSFVWGSRSASVVVWRGGQSVVPRR